MANAKPSRTVGAYEAKTRLSELLVKVEAGEEFTITRNGSPVARLVPIKPKPSRADRMEAVKRIERLGAQLSLGKLKARDLIAEGRK